MSRFGLRSCADGFKLLDEKNIRRKVSNLSSTSFKRTTQQKDSKFGSIVNSNDENLIDDFKVEPEDLEKESDMCVRFEKMKNPECAEDEDYDVDNDNDNYDEDDDDYKHQSSSCKESLVCSLPLDRINQIIQKLNLDKSKNYSKKETEEILIEEILDNDDDEDDDANISKQTSSNIKNLCLYCDRKFSSHKMQLKHVDKFHCLQQDRRCSGRNAQINQQQQSQVVSRKRKSTIETQNFPGCNFCQKSKAQSQPVILPASELSSLFIHLTDCHTDKYFGCKACIIRFQNLPKLSKHMEIIHKSLPFAFDENSSKSKDNDTDSPVSTDKSSIGERSRLSIKRQQRSQKSLSSCIAMNSTSQCNTAIEPNTSIIGAEEPILSRLGLTQNRLPNNRKGVRLRREKLLPEMLLKSEHNHTSSTNFVFGQTTSISASLTSTSTCSPKLRGKSIKSASGFSTDTNSDIVFRVPTRNDILSCVFDDNFYKEIISNVRNNLLFHLDGKIMGNSLQQPETNVARYADQPQIRSTLVKSPIVVTTMDSEIHAATSLATITAFPTLLTAEQFGGDASTSKIRRPHTKNSWKWKWDSVKKFKLINEGGKIVKKMKHPMLGLRDLSKLDMWTQLTMRQKHELQQQQKTKILDTRWHSGTMVSEVCSDPSREEKQRLNDQLNYILDMRLLPHIILEQNEQAIIKLENDEFGIGPTQIPGEDCTDNFMAQTFADESFLSMLNLLPNNDSENTRTKLVLSGEWARPRCYLCICCGSKFEKLKSLEEHKMFRHSQILSTHYEVVGRELLNGNLLRHLFIPKKALSRYGNGSDNNLVYSGAARRLFWHKNETLIREAGNNEESSDSLQSVLNSCVTNSPSLKNISSSTEDCCDIDTKISAITALQLVGNTAVVSPTHSIHSCSSSSSDRVKRQLRIRTSSGMLPVINVNINTSNVDNNNGSNLGTGCSKCGRKCNGMLDLYRHMLDCSGDYIWSLAKKRKYRYYCGSKKRRPCNKHSILEMKKNKNKLAVKNLSISNDNTTEEGAITSQNFTKTKTSPRSRPSDAESIKKMLENLPPKRICKKIFPSLSKTKKSKKNIKPKLLAKHKIYNNLRKTRVRQISQAAKILSKTKSQLKKPKKMATRSSSISVAVAKKINNNKKENIKLIMDKNIETKSSQDLISNEKSLENHKEEVMDEVGCSNIKMENKNAIDLLKNQSDISFKVKENESSVQVVKSTDSLVNLEKSKDSANNEISMGKTTVINPCNTTEIERNLVTEQISRETLCGTTSETLNSTVGPCNSVSFDNIDRNPQISNKNVKRSKRISDCIAMLTGKLEEKLKTEQKMLVSRVQDNIAPDINPGGLNECNPIISRQSTLCQITTPVKKHSATVEDDKCHLKKTPKRKAISRKIVKTDYSESNILPVMSTNLESKTFNNLKTADAPETFSTTKNRQQPVTMNTVNQKIIMPLQSMSTFSLQNEKQQTNNFISPTVPTMPPPVVPPNSSVLLPKVPLYMTLENLRHPISTSHVPPLPIAMSLPVPVPVPISIENVTQVPPSTISTSGGSSNIAILPTPGIPIMSAVSAHIAVPPTIQLTVPPFSSTNLAPEPLNLSNSSKNVQKQTQDLRCTGNQRVSGIPTRRQTICGFEVRNFAVFDEMEPLDLSKKPRSEKITATDSIPMRHIEMDSLLLPPQSSLATSNNPSVLPLPPLTPEALVNKPFYSNLDLLRIPQVRNPVVVQVSTNANEPVQQTVVTNTIAAMPQTCKTVSKKRNKPSNMQPPIHCNISCVGNSIDAPLVSTSTNAFKANCGRDTTNVTTSKKEQAVKNKPTLRMDVEVINHIDDAINSVINAVKASLDNEEAQKAKEMSLAQNQSKKQDSVLLKTIDGVNSTTESNLEFHYLTASRRNIRSKTLDCRPTALKTNSKSATFIPTNSTPQDVTTAATRTTITATTVQTSQNTDNIKFTDTKTESMAIGIPPPIYDEKRISGKEILKEADTKCEKKIEPKILEIDVKNSLTTQNKTISEVENIEKTLCAHPTGDIIEKASIVSNEIPAITTADNVEHLADRNVSTVTTTININLDLEQVSNNNNTSSGFHSSAQSDQQTSVMSTTTSAASVVAPGNDTKKKQRRRRKNELAAIVADQLLESFKLDKARRDNLKKLENLAYEKSEDLLLTGMLLMSSTKRNVASSSNNINSMVENNENIKRSGKFQRISQNNDVQKQNEVTRTGSKTVIENVSFEKSVENEKDPLEVNESTDGKKNSKRRQYRRRGKTLDNENISKLKSSLESFSIDIERQLSEYEAKNVNVFKNLVTNELSIQSCNSKNQIVANVNKPSIILRPSILSVTLESGGNQEISQTPAKPITNDGNKTVLSSRDPRLNKNIHKEGEKINEISGSTAEKVTPLDQKNNTGPEEIGDLDEDNYLTEIAKNVNEKIMSTENEEFAYKDDGFEMVNDVGMDDSNSKFSRPPTSMSVRSAPNLNDDRSNFGSICDENTNTEVMDMDLDDEMSVYTSYSQDLGRGRGRRRRRRRSILLTRKPKKKATSRDMSADKIECILCKKVFYSANSLSKHNMTLAHVSKVSEQEYLLSKSHSNIPNITNDEDIKSFSSLGPYARRSTRRSTISEPPMQTRCETVSPPPVIITQNTVVHSLTTDELPCKEVPSKSTMYTRTETHSSIQGELKQTELLDTKSSKSVLKPTLKDQSPDRDYHENININRNYNGNSRLNLNPDERLFFECCNILKSAETPRINNTVTIAEECNINTNYTYSYNNQEKPTPQSNNINRLALNNTTLDSSPIRPPNISASQLQLPIPQSTNCNVNISSQQPIMEQQTLFRDPQLINQSCCFNKPTLLDNRIARSPTYSGISHLSAVTNTTSRFKTKAAMKGYENVNFDLTQQQESKSRTICKLTELAEIALGNEEKPSSHDFSPIQNSLSPPPVQCHLLQSHQPPKVNAENMVCPKRLVVPEYVTSVVTNNVKDRNAQLASRNERTKNNDTRSSTSSKTIMHSSIIKAAVEEHQKSQTSNKIIIPDRPFKNIGLEEKETITFQKPKAPAVHLLTEDNNSISTGSFSDRDDYDFGSLSCDDEVSIKESNDKNQKNNSTDSSSESSRATAKTFENKSLIMGRIFKNASTKAVIKSNVNTVKVKSVGVQKDQTPVPKADLNQLFDELRGNSGVDGLVNDRGCNTPFTETIAAACLTAPNSCGTQKQNHQQRESIQPNIQADSPPAVVSSTTATPLTTVRKTKPRTSRAKTNSGEKRRKDISKLQTELGMSPDEIKKLIDDGQRKSKRRCATNRPKKLVEMWSSDEYEEFLSTKDIIALIEEKEQQEKRKKRKNSLNTTSNITEAAKEKEPLSYVTSSTNDTKRRNTRRMSLAVGHPENLLDRHDLLSSRSEKNKKANNKKEEPVSTSAKCTNACELVLTQGLEKPLPEKDKVKKGKKAETTISLPITSTNNNKGTGNKRSNNSNKTKSKPSQKPKQPVTKETLRLRYKRGRYDEEDESNEYIGMKRLNQDDDGDDDFLISELKNKQNKKTRGNKTKTSKVVAAASAAIITSNAKLKKSKISTVEQEISNKKRSSNNNNTNNSNIGSSINHQKRQQNSQLPNKSKRKNQSNQSPPRRKRLATEKLYYWSSSSDEDFGRINNNKSNPPPDNYENGGEQYQKHGWIVGDSHKKLVTLLAIAKGNKKVDLNSGVKKNSAKKRN